MSNVVFTAGYPVERPRLDMDCVERSMLSLEQEPCPVVHRFGPGIYIREVTLPKGIFALGHHQKEEHTNIVLRGKVLMEDGTTIEAPMMYVGKPGRKCGVILEETVWLNVYSTTETDIEKLEERFLEKSEFFIGHESERIAKETESIVRARIDYHKMLNDLCVTEELVRAQSENTDDQISMPYGSYKFQVGPSRIEGRGLFACSDITCGETIGIAREGSMRTPVGRYANHSGCPNSIMKRIGNNIVLVATKDIVGNRGGQMGEEILVDYRNSVEVVCLA